MACLGLGYAGYAGYGYGLGLGYGAHGLLW